MDAFRQRDSFSGTKRCSFGKLETNGGRLLEPTGNAVNLLEILRGLAPHAAAEGIAPRKNQPGTTANSLRADVGREF